MKKSTIFGLLAVLIVAAGAAWYLLRDRDAARDVLPADAFAVAVLEPAELFRGLDIPMDKARKLVYNFKDFAEGIDLTKPVYAFSAESGLSGLTLSVRDEAALLKAFSAISFASEEVDGIWWIANSNSIGCMDGDKLLLIAPVAESLQDDLRPAMTKLMRQSRRDVPAIERTKELKGFLRMSAAAEGIGTVGAALSIGEQDVTLTTEVTDPTPEAKSAMEVLSKSTGLLSTIKGDNPFAWLYASMDGEKLLPLLRSNPDIRNTLMLLNVGVLDADLFLKAVKGDVLIAMHEPNMLRPELYGMISVRSTDFLANADEWAGLTRIGEKDYLLSYDDWQLYFRDLSGSIMFATTPELFEAYLRADNTEPGLQQKAAGTYLSASVDVGGLLRSNPAYAILLAAVPMISDVAVVTVDKVNAEMDAPGRLKLSVTTRKPIKDICLKDFQDYFNDQTDAP